MAGAPFATPAPGTVFANDFRIVRPLKAGGMGAVFVAEQLSTGAERALKFLHPHLLDDAAMRRRFEQEARAASRIESDHVVEVIGAGVDEATKLPWIAMELLEGEDLGEYVARRGKLDRAEVLEILGMMCHAVAAAHDAGLVHRDLKPENVFLARSRRRGEAYTIKVLDFGIARATADVRTSSTAAVGSPLWMAPEQTARGPVIGPQTDVWAIGLVAFQLLTGTWYWRTAHEQSPSITQFLRELTLEPLDAASRRAEELGVGPLPEGFDAWFARCVDRDPRARYADARAAFEPLRAVLSPSTSLATAATAEIAHDPATAFVPAAQPAAFAAAPPKVASTAPGTAVTGPADAQRPRRRVWAIALPVVLCVGVATAWAVVRRPPGVQPAASAMVVPPTAPSTAAAASEAAVAAAGRQMADESPRVVFPGAVFPVGYAKGAVDERPVHDVSFPSFSMMVDEVTVEQYARCVTIGRCTPAGTSEFCNAGHPERARNPVNCVTEPQAETYCAWLGRRLPTEDEWEYAASGMSKRLYAWGNTPPDAGTACVGRGHAGTCDIHSFPAADSPEGLHDITGDVWEWTSSDYCPYPTGLGDDDGKGLGAAPHCAHDQKVARGGGWFGCDPNLLRTQVRQGYPPDLQSANVGFRCARSL